MKDVLAAVVRSIRRVAVETSNYNGLLDFKKMQKTKKIAFRYVLDTFFIEDLKDYLDTWIIFCFYSIIVFEEKSNL